jgi:hypothetical protein
VLGIDFLFLNISTVTQPSQSTISPTREQAVPPEMKEGEGRATKRRATLTNHQTRTR